MTVNDFISACKPEEGFQIMDYIKNNDEIGERVYFFGDVWEFAANEALVKKYGERTVQAITRGLVSLIVAV